MFLSGRNKKRHKDVPCPPTKKKIIKRGMEAKTAQKDPSAEGSYSLLNETELQVLHFLVCAYVHTCIYIVAVQGCQTVFFQTKNPNLGKFWRVLQWKLFVYLMSILVYLTPICQILWPFGMFSGYFV
jgi:hypothetical protein